jgi:diacylglycerol kinase family enzyme
LHTLSSRRSHVRLTLFHNPTAGHGRHDTDDLVELLRSFGHTVHIRDLDDDWVSATGEDLGELVVVAGGDGTVARVAARMLGRAVPLAVLPAGTANNIATALGLHGDSRELIAAWPQSQPVAVDIGWAEVDGKSAPFLECVGTGGVGRLMAHSSALERDNREEDRDRKLVRDLSLLRERVLSDPPQGVSLVIDGKDHGGEYVVVEVMNVPVIGPRLALAPHATIDDGKLHVVLVRHADRQRLVDYLDARRIGAAVIADLEVVPCERVSLACGIEDLHIDGELWSGDDALLPLHARAQVELSLLPGGLTFLCPAATIA